ncbi:hypothetical protein GCM10023090_09760 [Acidovorax lacteus]|uniref:Uncharacterized protein n=1 Tax=Acidovorax lacteus TaxID=1924988 RepID=A0ABP8L3Q4_9BURK
MLTESCAPSGPLDPPPQAASKAVASKESAQRRDCTEIFMNGVLRNGRDNGGRVSVPMVGSVPSCPAGAEAACAASSALGLWALALHTGPSRGRKGGIGRQVCCRGTSRHRR